MTEFRADQLNYLSAMGIDVWVSRPANWEDRINKPVPAKEQAITQGLASAASVLAEPKQAAAPMVPSQNQEVGQVLPQPSGVIESTKARVQEPASTIDVQSTKHESVPRFQLQFWCYRQGLWLVHIKT